MDPDDFPVELELGEGMGGTVLLGLVRAAPVAAAPAGEALLSEMDALASELRRAWEGRAPSEIPGLGPARDLYRAFGIDPTRKRPSSEALLRRVLRGQSIPRILGPVDVCNLCSLRVLLSIGLYDREKIRGGVVLRPGRPGEAYAGIRKDTIHLEGRPALIDDEGPFGNPSADSLRTSIGERTRSLWMVIFAPAAYSRERLEGHVRFARDALARHLAPPGETVRTSGSVVP